jgi:hypothetical protein
VTRAPAFAAVKILIDASSRATTRPAGKPATTSTWPVQEQTPQRRGLFVLRLRSIGPASCAAEGVEGPIAAT